MLPASIQDDSTLALESLINRLGTLDLTALLVYIIDSTPAAALPHLAEQLHVTGYEGWMQATNEAERRALLKSALQLHRYRGTPYAVKSALESISMVAIVREWFQYAGEPFHFRVSIDLYGQGIDAERLALVDLLIQHHQNVRSRLDGVDFTYNLDSAVPVWGASMHDGEIITVYPHA